MRRWQIFTLSACLVVVLVPLALSDEGRTVVLGFTPLVPLFLLWLVRKRLQVVPLSPVWLTAIMVAGVGSIGYFLADTLSGLRGGSIMIYLEEEEKVGTALVFAVSVLAFTLGAVIATATFKKRPRITFGAYEASYRARAWMLVIALLPLVVIFGALGTDLFARDTYLASGANRAIFGLGQQLATAVFALVGYVAAAGRGGQRLFALLLTVAYVGVFFGLGSRRLAILPLVFVIGVLMAHPTRIWLRLGIAGAISALALPVPLFLRNLQEHGFTAYLADLGNYDLGDVDWLTTLNNILIAFPITGVSGLRWQARPIDYYLVSINPVSGDNAGWYEISNELRLNAYTPFSTVGELWNYGAVPAVLTWGVLGVLAVWLDRSVGKLWAARVPFIGLAVVGLSALFALQSLQYNLRSSSRMMLYALLIALAGLVYVHLRDGTRATRAARLAVEDPATPRQNLLHTDDTAWAGRSTDTVTRDQAHNSDAVGDVLRHRRLTQQSEDP